MPTSATRLMTIDEFFVWQQGQDECYELVEGVPVMMRDPLTMMMGASTQHERIAARDGERWLPTDYDGQGGTIELPSIACRLEMSRIYRGVAFAAEE